MKDKSLSKVLIIQTAFLGDVVLSTALLEKLYLHYPDAKIDVLVRKGNESLLEHHPFLNQVLVFDKKQKIKNLYKLLKKIRREKYDLVVNLHRFASSGLLAAFSNAKWIVGFSKNPFSFLYHERKEHIISADLFSKYLPHEVERNQSLIIDWTDSNYERPKLYPPIQDYTKDLKEQKYVCIAPASVWFTKQFPVKKWIELINKIPNSNTIYLLGAPNDKKLCEDIKSKSQHPNVQNMAGKLSLLQSVGYIQYAEMNYVNDSAPLHLASAVNAPVVAVFCSTVPQFGFTPLSDTQYVLENPTQLSCRPCGLHGKKKCPLQHFSCSEIPISLFPIPRK